jgi:hypothetical protein
LVSAASQEAYGALLSEMRRDPEGFRDSGRSEQLIALIGLGVDADPVGQLLSSGHAAVIDTALFVLSERPGVRLSTLEDVVRLSRSDNAAWRYMALQVAAGARGEGAFRVVFERLSDPVLLAATMAARLIINSEACKVDTGLNDLSVEENGPLLSAVRAVRMGTETPQQVVDRYRKASVAVRLAIFAFLARRGPDADDLLKALVAESPDDLAAALADLMSETAMRRRGLAARQRR